MLTINITEQESCRKHPIVFETLEEIDETSSFIIQNDHDPKPLYYQMVAHLGEVFDWEYIKAEGNKWEVKITKLKEGEKPTSLGELTAKDYRRAKVFEKFGLDFCCGGNKTLFEACKDKGIDLFTVEEELKQVGSEQPLEHDDDCNCWKLDVLTGYIINKHHAYVRQAVPDIIPLLNKIIDVHGNSHPELAEIGTYFNQIAGELEMHMMKEEHVLFPYINSLEESKANNTPLSASPFGSVKNPINMMEAEHDDVGEVIENVKSLTNNFTPPKDACNTFIVTYKHLEEFDADLRKHIHLENNILFPKAIALEAELVTA